ncbi:MAG: hypothetical protein GDA38_27830 [Hormoscilla sp. SP12CHS1]|nr:hypothetical protein [Hormoscilla sp. SP12CHS1]
MNKARLRGLDYKSEMHPISHLTLLTGQRSPPPFLPLCANAILLYNGCSALEMLAMVFENTGGYHIGSDLYAWELIGTGSV